MPTTRDVIPARKREVQRPAKPAVKRAAKRAVPRSVSGAVAITFDPMHDNVFEAMGLPDATERLVKAEMAREISLIVQAKGWNQKRTAEELCIAASDVSDLLRGKLRRFSQERLERFLNALDMDVHIVICPRPDGKARADISVARVASFNPAS